MARYERVERALGPELFARVRSARVLMVGAGGIGCELLKNLVMSGFLGHVEVIDLDTIDVSNLNRQFLFQRQHVGKSKAQVARDTALQFEPAASIVAHHASIFEQRFGVDFFRGFDLVIGALDNVPARRHVNRMCLAADVPLIESGTAGFLGQVTVIKKGVTECFECNPHPAPKTYPVCTIRSTPTAPVHCVVWAKEYLFAQLFGDGEDDTALEQGASAGENASEIAELKREAEALRQLRDLLGSAEAPQAIFEKVFERDIERLLGMKDMWRNRRPPVPLRFADVASMPRAGAGTDSGNSSAATLRDQQLWPLGRQCDVFLDSVQRLAQRYVSGNRQALSFDKDDDDCLDFVCATANLRAHIYGIDMQTRFHIKSIAGNIIPAIATTNAVIAGLIVMQAFNILAGKLDQCSTTYLIQSGRRRLLVKEKLAPPRAACYVCSNQTARVRINTRAAALRVLVENVLQKHLAMQQPSISAVAAGDVRLLYDIEFDDNLDTTLEALGIRNGQFLNAEDELQDYKLEIEIVDATSFAEEGAVFELIGGGAAPPQPKEQAAPKVDDGRPSSAAAAAAAAAAVLNSGPVVIDDDVTFIG